MGFSSAELLQKKETKRKGAPNTIGALFSRVEDWLGSFTDWYVAASTLRSLVAEFAPQDDNSQGLAQRRPQQSCRAPN